MFGRNRNQHVNLDETISIGPYQVYRLRGGSRLRRLGGRRYHVFIPLVGLFDNKAHLIYACIQEVRAGNFAVLEFDDEEYEGGVLLEFFCGNRLREHNVIYRALDELDALYEQETGGRLG